MIQFPAEKGREQNKDAYFRDKNWNGNSDSGQNLKHGLYREHDADNGA
jgi:hypothetical protein